MLSLGRETHESIDITSPDGTRVNVMVIKASYGKTRLAVHAPDDWLIDRHEITVEKAREAAAVAAAEAGRGRKE